MYTSFKHTLLILLKCLIYISLIYNLVASTFRIFFVWLEINLIVFIYFLIYYNLYCRLLPVPYSAEPVIPWYQDYHLILSWSTHAPFPHWRLVSGNPYNSALFFFTIRSNPSSLFFDPSLWCFYIHVLFMFSVFSLSLKDLPAILHNSHNSGDPWSRITLHYV